MVTLEQVAEALGRPADRLQLLDRRPLQPAFAGGSYETVVVRDRASGETVEATFDSGSGERVDAGELRRRDRDLAEQLEPALAPALRDLLLRHPALPAVRVAVTREGAPGETVRTSAAGIVALAQEPDVTLVELAEDPEIPD